MLRLSKEPQSDAESDSKPNPVADVESKPVGDCERVSLRQHIWHTHAERVGYADADAIADTFADSLSNALSKRLKDPEHHTNPEPVAEPVSKSNAEQVKDADPDA